MPDGKHIQRQHRLTIPGRGNIDHVANRLDNKEETVIRPHRKSCFALALKSAWADFITYHIYVKR